MNPCDDQAEDLENNWKDDEVFALIHLWQENLVEFSKPRRNLSTCKIIAENLQEITKRLIPRTAKEIQEKLTNLRRQYNANKKKYGHSGKRSPWRFYKAIHKFRSTLTANETSINSSSYLQSLPMNIMSDAFECSDDQKDTESVLIKGFNTVGQPEEPSETYGPDCVVGYNDEFSTFGDNVAWTLRNIKDRKMVCLAKYKINTILFEAEMGMLRFEGNGAFAMDNSEQICDLNTDSIKKNIQEESENPDSSDT